jgi:hypothetical protein
MTGTHRGEAEGDDLGDRDEVDLGAAAIGIDGCQYGHASEVEPVAGGGDEYRHKDADDEVQQDVGGVDLEGFGGPMLPTRRRPRS